MRIASVLSKFLPSTPLLLAIMFVAGTGSGAWVTYNAMKSGEVRALNSTIRSLNASAAETAAKIAASEQARQEATDTAARWRNQYYQEKRNDKVFDQWGSTPMPAAASDLMCKLARCLPPGSTAPASP